MAEGIKRIAKAYYERANEEEKNEAKDFFKKLDLNGDGKISLAEFKTGVHPWLSVDEFFRKLDSNSDGALYFGDVLVPFYFQKGAIVIPICCECRQHLPEPYFACFQCLSKYPHTYGLCYACYRGAKFQHPHPLSDLLHDQAALYKFICNAQTQNEMGGVRRIASAKYARKSEEERNKAEAYFRNFDSNGDGKINLTEYNKNVSPDWLSGEEVFKKLDSNGDGALEFSDLLVLYHLNTFPCKGCDKPIFGPIIFCTQCLSKHPFSYQLCCECYQGGKYQHEHPLSDLVDEHSALIKLIEQTKTQAKSEMEELGEIARAYYRAASPKVQVLAKEFFNSMDSDGDGQVRLPEFESLMRQEGYLKIPNIRHFFNELDTDGNGTLDFWEVVTLVYIITIGRPFCDGCKEFIPGIFFVCIECCNLDNPENSFNLCRRCYPSAASKHNHTQFMDNHRLLQATQAALGQAILQQMRAHATSTSSSQATGSATQKAAIATLKTVEIGLKAADIASNASDIANTAATIASVAASCTIM